MPFSPPLDVNSYLKSHCTGHICAGWLIWLPSPPQRKPRETFGGYSMNYLGGDRKNLRNYLTDLLRCLKQAKAEHAKLQ
jgi:hypothetical protein